MATGTTPTQAAAPQSRTGAFTAAAPPTNSTPPSLQMEQMRQNAAAPHSFGGVVPAFHPTGTNQQVMPSGIGSSDKDKGRMLLGGGFLPAQNGVSAETYQQTRPFLSTTLGY